MPLQLLNGIREFHYPGFSQSARKEIDMIGRAPHQCQISDLAAVLQKQPGTGIQTDLVNVHFIADWDRKKHGRIRRELLAKRPGIG